MDYYQLTSTMNLKYIYLRNYLYVEKLSSDDIEKIINLSDSELQTPSDDLYNLVESTYKKVIDSKFNTNNIRLMKCYGIDRDKFWYDLKALVFGIRHDEFNMHGMNDDDWQENYFDQTDYLNDLMKRLKEELSEKIGIEVGAMLYNEFTVKKQIRQ